MTGGIKLRLALALFIPIALAAAISDQSLEEAMGIAGTEGKYLYVAFIGEGWSVSSDRFNRTILESTDFQSFASDKLVYFPVKARRKPPLTKDETAKLQAWVIHFDIKSYPTIIILAPDGQEVLRHGYKDLKPEAYVALLKAIMP